MLNVYLFIELLGSAMVDSVITDVRELKFDRCQIANVVALSDEKVVAQIDCEDSDAAVKAVLQKFTQVDGIVQTNLIAAVKPKDG